MAAINLKHREYIPTCGRIGRLQSALVRQDLLDASTFSLTACLERGSLGKSEYGAVFLIYTHETNDGQDITMHTY